MTRKMTKEEAQAWKARWRLVNEKEIELLRQTPPEVRLRQFNTLLGWAHSLGWSESLSEGVEEVRQRWRRLREVYHAAKHKG